MATGKMVQHINGCNYVLLFWYYIIQTCKAVAI